MKYPDDRRKCREAIDAACRKFRDEMMAGDGHVDVDALRAYVDETVNIKVTKNSHEAYHRAQIREWIKERFIQTAQHDFGKFVMRDKDDGSIVLDADGKAVANPDAWIWIPRPGSEYQQLGPGYYVQARRAAEDGDADRFVKREGNSRAAFAYRVEAMTGLMVEFGPPPTTKQRPSRRATNQAALDAPNKGR